MSSHVLNKRQFASGAPQIKKDPSSGSKPKFSGAEGSKTMTVQSGKLPHAPKKHPHHYHAGKRTRRAH
jgi:hypothetical protein